LCRLVQLSCSRKESRCSIGKVTGYARQASN
jgi:hypothetical protein